jgi:hypothetical protein
MTKELIKSVIKLHKNNIKTYLFFTSNDVDLIVKGLTKLKNNNVDISKLKAGYLAKFSDSVIPSKKYLLERL